MSRTYSNTSKATHEKTTNFFDFVDFFLLLKDSVNNALTNEALYSDLTYVLHEDANWEINNIKDAISKILRKKIGFKNLLESATPMLIEPLADYYEKSSFIINYITQPQTFTDKVLYRVKQDAADNELFNGEDVAVLESNRDNLPYILAFVLIRTIAKSAEYIFYCHPADYNPFAHYRFPEFTAEANSSCPDIKNILERTSRYMFDEMNSSRHSFPKFRSELLSNGISCNDAPGKFNLDSTFSILENSPESKSLSSYLRTTKNLLIIGEGGIGKTTFLYSCLNEHHTEGTYSSIPLYIKLSDCSTSTDHQYIIQTTLQKKISFAVNGNKYISFKDFRDEFAKPCAENELPQYTLLLDGFNEITPMDFGEIRRAISKEIAELLSFPNVRIILTSRDNEFYHVPLAKFEIIRANGIEETDVINHLRTVYQSDVINQICANSVLMEYLRIPLFLLMYVNSNHSDFSTPANRGAILFTHFNSGQSFYNEKLNTEEKTTREAYLMVSVILDFLLPDLGYYMKSHNIFQISEDMLEELISSAVTSANRFINLNADAYHRYEQRPGSLKRALHHFSTKLYAEDVLCLLRDYLCVMISDSNNRLSFAHQYIRDYFCALYCVREFYYMTLIADRQPALLADIDCSWGNSLWDDEQISLVQEILSIPSEFQKDDLIYNTIDLFRQVHHYPLPDMKYALSNLISVLALANDGDLFRYDFSSLDLNNCTLANLNFHNFADGCSSSFCEANIGIDTFSTNAHDSNVLKWAISSDGQFIISISSDLELKIWNISTQKCVATRQCPPLDHVGAISSLELHNQGTLVLITYKEEPGYTFASATYDLQAEVYTLYLLPGAHVRNIIYFGYDSGSNTLISVLDNGNIYRYEVNEENPIEQLHLCVERPFSIGYFHLLSRNKLLYRLDQILYIYDLISRESTALAMPEEYGSSRIAVSRDNRLIALEIHGLIYIYHSDTPERYFRFPVGLSTDDFTSIAFCHDDTNILTAYGYGSVYHMDCSTGAILYYTFVGQESNFIQSAITQNYRVTQEANRSTTMLQVTNIYTKVSNYFLLSNQKPLMDTYVDCVPNTFHALYENGTLLTFDADTMKLTDSFNYAPGRFISASTQSDPDALLCFASVPSSYYPYTKQTQLTVVDLSTGIYKKSAPIFDQIFELRFVNRNMVVALSATDIMLIDLETFNVKSRCEHRCDIHHSTTHIFVEDKKIHVTTDFSPEIAHVEYSATVDTYVINEQGDIALKEVTHVPCPWQIIPPCPLMYSILDSSGLALVKAMKPSEQTYIAYRNYEYTTPNESHFRMFFSSEIKYELLDHWTLASLGNSHTQFGYQTVADGNVQVDEKFFDPTGDNLICVGDSYYEHRVSTHECIPLDSALFTSMDRLNYSRKKRAIYYNDRQSSSIHRYDIDEHRTTVTSNYLHPHILVYGCDFGGCTGEVGSVPWYMAKSVIASKDGVV